MSVTPSIVQTVVDDPPTSMGAGGGTRVVPWGTPTLSGSRLMCFVGENDNQIDTVTVLVTGGGTWVEVTPPGDVIRQATGHNEIALRCFERLNVGAGAASVSVAFNSDVYPTIILVEVKDSNTSTATDTQNSATGSLQTAAVSAGPTTRPDILWLAAFASGNKDTHSIPPGDTSGFAIAAQGGSGGAGNAAKVNMSVLSKSVNVSPDNETASVLIAGGFNHNFAGMLLAIPGAGAGGGGGGPDPFGLPNTDDGTIHRACSLHYYGGGIVADAGGTALQNAQTLASFIDICVANVIQAITATGNITTDKFNGLADNMIAVNSDLMLMPYDKSAQIDEGVSFYPNDYYAHACPWPTGAKLTTFSSSIYVAQPGIPAAGQSAFVDPRGWTSHSFKEQRSRDAWSRVAKYNSVYGADTLKGVYHDSMGTSTWKGSQCNPDTNTLYSEDPWIATVWGIGDESRARRPFSNYMVMGNGLVSGSGYFGAHSLGNMLLHTDGGLAENWLRNNLAAPSAFHTESGWQQDVNMVIDANVTKGKWFWGVINICNLTAGSGTCPSFSTAQLEQWRRYSMATYLLSNRGKSVMEFVENTNLKPWDETHPYYNVQLGPAIDTAASALASKHTEGTQPPGSTLYSYRRRYTSGCVWVNPTTNPVTITMDRDYKTPVGVTPSATYLTGTTQVLPANSGLVLLTTSTGGTNAGPPTLTFWAYPPATTKIANAPIQVFYSDPDGVASAEYNLNGAGWHPLTFQVGNGDWEQQIVLSLGVNTIQTRATDANPSPLTSSPATHTVTLVANDGPPSVTFNNPPTSVSVATQLVQLTVTDGDGITSVEVSVNNQTSWQPAVFNSGSGKWEVSVTLLEGNNTIWARATDAYPVANSPGNNIRSNPVSRNVLVTTPQPPPPPPPAPTPDPNQIPSIGQGEYQLAILSRGGGAILQTITDWSQIDWERVEGATGQAQVQIVGADSVAACCNVLADVEPWSHEIGIYRKDPTTGRFKRAWCGPVIDMDVNIDKITIDAFDLSKWLERRRVHKDHVNMSDQDLATLIKVLADDGILPDPSMKLSTTATPSGQVGRLNLLASAHPNCMDEIKQLAGLGCSWTTYQRTLRIGGDLTLPSSVTTLIDDHFIKPTVRRDGASTANSPGVRGQGVGDGSDAIYGSTTDPASIAKYGLLEVDTTDDAATTDQIANQASVQQVALYGTPPIVLSGGRLSPLAPITMEMLVPGNVVRVALAQLCVPVAGDYRIQSVKGSVTADAETIDVVFQPLGASSA